MEKKGVVRGRWAPRCMERKAKGKENEVDWEDYGKEEEECHQVVRGRWAPLHRGKGSKGRAANGNRPVGAACCRRELQTMVLCQLRPPSPLGGYSYPSGILEASRN